MISDLFLEEILTAESNNVKLEIVKKIELEINRDNLIYKTDNKRNNQGYNLQKLYKIQLR